MPVMPFRPDEELASRIKAAAWRERVSVNKWLTYAALSRLDELERETYERTDA